MSTLFTLKNAALLILVSAILHLITPLLAGGLTPDAVFMMQGGALYLLFAFGLYRNWRWVPYFAFIMMLAGTLISFGFSFDGTTIPAWLYGVNAAFSFLAAIALFVSLWRPRQTT